MAARHETEYAEQALQSAMRNCTTEDQRKHMRRVVFAYFFDRSVDVLYEGDVSESLSFTADPDDYRIHPDHDRLVQQVVAFPWEPPALTTGPEAELVGMDQINIGDVVQFETLHDSTDFRYRGAIALRFFSYDEYPYRLVVIDSNGCSSCARGTTTFSWDTASQCGYKFRKLNMTLEGIEP